MNIKVGMSLAEIEKEVVRATLRFFDGNKRRTADTLGVSLKTIYNMIDKYQIDTPAWPRSA